MPRNVPSRAVLVSRQVSRPRLRSSADCSQLPLREARKLHPEIAPSNTGEPRTTGTPAVGQILSATNGTWSGSDPKTYAFRWLRCNAAGSQSDGSDCTPINGASSRNYEVRNADAGFRLRVRVTATNVDGSASAASNPTAVVPTAKPVNTTEPSISGATTVGSILQANRGRWSGDNPITYAFVWLRCNQKGDNCSEIQGANDPEYEIRDSDSGRTIRVRVIARNDHGSTSAISNPTGVVGSNQPPPPPPGSSVAVEDLKAAGDRLVIASVQFSPNPVTSSTAPITVRVRVTARGGRPVRGALVFMRGTPRVVEGQTQATQADGFVTLTLVPTSCSRGRGTASTSSSSSRRIARATRGSAASPATGSSRFAWRTPNQADLQRRGGRKAASSQGVDQVSRCRSSPRRSAKSVSGRALAPFVHVQGRITLNVRPRPRSRWTSVAIRELARPRASTLDEPDPESAHAPERGSRCPRHSSSTE